MTNRELAEQNVKDFKWPQLVKDEKPKKMIVVESCGTCKVWVFCKLVTSTYLNPDEIHPDCHLTDYKEASNL